MQGNVTYYHQTNNIDFIYLENSTKSYATHTHANHVTIGYILDGIVCIACYDRKSLYHAGEFFYIMPDIPHALEPVSGCTYSMISICVPVDRMLNHSEKEVSYTKRLKQLILDAPENKLSIQDMAYSIDVSPYHMIRQFKNACGLTPHQFQIQSRVRKAQRLLEEGQSVIEAAYATGFCDQSHFDRCFRKIVRLTPNEYKQSVEVLF